MQLRYDDDFVEAVVFAYANAGRRRASPLQIRRFHHERERCYAVLDPDERDAAFFKVHLSWFREWGLESPLTCVLEEYPLLPAALSVLAFRQARGKTDEGAELFVNQELDGDARNAVVALCTGRFERDTLLASFLRHEFIHLSDMVDPGFGYCPFVPARGASLTQQRITRERYRLLWDITIDGRLVGSGRPTTGTCEHLRAQFGQAYSFWSERRRQEVFDSLWTDRAPRHEHLLSLASDPRDLSRAAGPSPGAPCPLCGFSTFHWSDESDLDQDTITALRRQLPGWSPEQGVCYRCAEIHLGTAGLELPSTVCL